MDRYSKPLVVGNTDTYTYTIDPEWLGAETIVAHDVIVDAKVTKNSSAVTGGVIGVSLDGVASGGSILHYEWTTSSGRSDCAKVLLAILANC